MKTFLLFFVATCVSATLITQEFVDEINSKQNGWTAKLPSRFEHFEDVERLCGTVMKGEYGYFELPEKNGSNWQNVRADIPDTFDVRTNWPQCASVSGHIRDQSACGSCWAFGSTEALNDRLCIKTGRTQLLSVEDTTSCCGFLQCFSNGCNGGQPSGAWNWFTKNGVVTGGDYVDIGKDDTCLPYSFPACAHHVDPSADYPACPSKDYSTPSCVSTCSNKGYPQAFKSDKVKATSSYSLSGVAKIQSDIMTYGSATAAFTVYQDFPTYSGGVYRHVSGRSLGGHAIKMIGWGTENGQDYWLIANSWNPTWGVGGTFKIARGNNECGIEGQVSAGTV